jgi:hypothetical protein
MTNRFIRLVRLTCFIFAAGSSVLCAADIVPLDGKPLRGTITGVDAQFVSYKDEGGTAAKIPVKDLAAVDLGGKIAGATTTYDEVELTDGTLFRISDFKVKGKTIQLKPSASLENAGTLSMEIPLNTLFYWVRKAGDGNNRADWRREVIAKRGKRDMLVIREKRDTVDVLQPIEGTVLEGNAAGTGVSFERADGTKQDYPFGRISGGLLFSQPPQAVIPPTACKVLDVYGNVLFAKSVELTGETVKVKTVSGATIEYGSTAAINKLDFSQGNVKYLADLEAVLDAPAAIEGEPYLPFLLNKTPGGSGFRLGGKNYPKGVWIAPETSLTYKLDGDYREFKAMFGIDDTIQVGSATVKVVIEADGRALFTETIVRKTGKPVAVNLNVKDVKVLKIRVDHDGLYSGASLDLADARFQK